jgi:phosphatidylglycerol:prolipoprotein diacylglycerol transferase
MEGIILFTVLLIADRRGARRRPGTTSGIFLIGYGIARIIVETVRQPDTQLDFLVQATGGVTMGQILSLPMLALGTWLIWRAKPIEAPAAA